MSLRPVDSDVRLFSEHSTSDLQTLMHLVKANIGTGFLGMAFSVRHAGILLGPICLLIIGFISTYSMGLLADCSHHLCKKTKSVSLDYGEVAYEATHLSAAKRFNSYANIARITVNTFLFFSQLVFCSIYIIFISDNIQQIYIQFHPNHTPVVQVFMVILTIVILLISYIKNLDALAIYSAIGNLILIVGSVIVFEYLIAGIVENKTDISSLPLFDTVANFPIFFGTAVFSYEGIGVVLPVENKMKHPRHFKKTLHISMAIVTILYIFMGTLGYMRFGLDVKDTITLNLPQDQGLYISVRIMLSLVLVVSYAIQFYVPIQITWPTLRGLLQERLQTFGEYVYRTILVLFTLAVAAAIPQLALFISLVGSFTGSALTLIFPAILDELTFYSSYDTTRAKRRLFKNLFVILFGVIGFIFGTAVSILNLIEVLSSASTNCTPPPVNLTMINITYMIP